MSNKKCPDCGGLPGIYPRNQCPVCYVKEQYTINPDTTAQLRQKLANKELEYFKHRYNLTERQCKELDQIIKLLTADYISQLELPENIPHKLAPSDWTRGYNEALTDTASTLQKAVEQLRSTK